MAKQSEVTAALNRLQRRLPGVVLEHANGGWALETRDGSRRLSPRLSSGAMVVWLDAFMAGWDEHRHRRLQVVDCAPGDPAAHDPRD